jgi:hypothetical protein
MISVSTLISLVSLCIAIASFVYTWHFNRYSIFVDSQEHEEIEGNKYYSFVISNCSPRPLVINNVELLNNGGRFIKDNGYVFAKPGDIYSSPEWNSQPFQKPVSLLPYSDISFSYYLDEYPAQIKVTANHRINKLRYYQLFNA